ncbi:hypothetical protein OFS02_14010 [Brachyspira hyodysenteriae]|nr:hypothetical protein [Brachyspira hyodysenteriae]MDA0093363.1 hypothetical protein [Brachyspira hyodysenteriae]
MITIILSEYRLRPILNGILEKGYKIVYDKKYVPYINKKEKFARVLIQKE